MTFTINIPQMFAYVPAPWILWVLLYIKLQRVSYVARLFQY